MVVREFNCTPSEAKHELRHNPHMGELIATHLYQRAHAQVDAWSKLDHDQRKDRTPPEGPWVDRVHVRRKATLESMFEERDTQLTADGRA